MSAAAAYWRVLAFRASSIVWVHGTRELQDEGAQLTLVVGYSVGPTAVFECFLLGVLPMQLEWELVKQGLVEELPVQGLEVLEGSDGGSDNAVVGSSVLILEMRALGLEVGEGLLDPWAPWARPCWMGPDPLEVGAGWERA